MQRSRPGRASGLQPEPVKALGRLLEVEGKALELRFRNVGLPRSSTGGVSMFACQHLTPEPMRRPVWLAHPNGARAIHSCTIAASDPAPLREAMVRLFGAAAITVTDEVVAAHTGHGVLIAAPPEDARLMHPMAEFPEHLPEPRLVALSVTVTDRDRAADFLRLQGVEFERSPNGDVLLPPRETHGVALELVHL